MNSTHMCRRRIAGFATGCFALGMLVIASHPPRSHESFAQERLGHSDDASLVAELREVEKQGLVRYAAALAVREKRQEAKLSLSNCPIGSVVAYPGDWPPIKDQKNKMHWKEDELGWKLCDGRLLPVEDYEALYNAIGTVHGYDGKESESFRLPDYRGLFLRGLVGDTKDPTILARDPDRNTRTAMNAGGNEKNRVGSTQADAIKDHVHLLGYGVTITGAKGDPRNEITTNADHRNLNKHNSIDMHPKADETRPKNAYVNWIIRVK